METEQATSETDNSDFSEVIKLKKCAGGYLWEVTSKTLERVEELNQELLKKYGDYKPQRTNAK